MTNNDLARRFLHTNLNCTDTAAAAKFYADALGLSCRMRTEAQPGPGTLFGMDQTIHNDAWFLYDDRGPRRICAIELLDWYDPVVYGEVYPDLDHVGLHRLGFVVTSTTDAERALVAAGATIRSHRVGPAVLQPDSTRVLIAEDPNGIGIEVIEVPTHDTDPRSSRITATCSDLERSVQFYRAIGFNEVERVDTTAADIDAAAVAPEQPVIAVKMQLPDHDYALVLLGWPQGDAHGQAYQEANHRGLFRMALSVDTITAARAEMDPSIIGAADEPIWCEMPGTPLGGLFVQFLKDPDGVTVELVERARSEFKAAGE